MRKIILMSHIRRINIFIFIGLLVTAILSCSKLRHDAKADKSCKYAECHISTPLTRSEPETGKHNVHISAGLTCYNCHNNYSKNKSHKNGTVDADNGAVIVFFNSNNPAGSWSDTDGKCATLACHGDAYWYGDTANGCTVCHFSQDSINPLVINTEYTSGKHRAHVTNRGYACETCHLGYRSQGTHRNGVLEKGSTPPGQIVYFDATRGPGTGASFIDNTNATGAFTCSVACHGVADWYSSQENCLICHGMKQDNGDSFPGSGRRAVSGEFSTSYGHSHFGTAPDNNSCPVCHDQSNHKKGYVQLFAQDNEYTGTTNSSGKRIYRFLKADDLSRIYDLSNFCLGCHDSNGATRQTALGGSPMDPFGSGGTHQITDIAQKLQGTLKWEESFGTGVSARGTRRKVNSHHDIGYADQEWSGSRIECQNCHNAHSAAKARPLADPFNTTSPWDYDPATGTAGQINTFCLTCHGGGDPANPLLPPGIVFQGTTKPLVELSFSGRFDASRSGLDCWRSLVRME